VVRLLRLVSLFPGYVASRALPPAADYLDVFRHAGTVAQETPVA
jgi:hypothetical protein